MKKMLPLLFSVLLCLAGGVPAYAYHNPGVPAAFLLAFGEPTPPTNNSAGTDPTGKAPDETPDKAPDKAPDETSNKTPSDDTQAEGDVVYQYDSGAYATEKTVDQQIIEEAQQQYGGPRLASLSVGGLSLIPVFSGEAFYYTAYVPEEQSSVSISARAVSGSVYIDGVAGGTRQIALGSGERTVRVIVTEQNSSTTYSILLLRQQQIQPMTAPQLPADFPVLTHVQLANDDFFYEQDITTTGGDIFITLPAASKKSFSITLSANTEVLTYCNNIRVYNVVYNTQAGAWQWKRQNIHMSPTQETRLEIFLANKKSLEVQNTYSLILQQPQADLNIQLQVGNDQAMVNSTLHELDAPPVIMEGHTMVPLRFIAEALGAQVSWHSEEQRVELNWQGQTLELFIGRLTDNMPQAPFIDNGRTMVPLRYVSERLKCQVEWQAATREIIITR